MCGKCHDKAIEQDFGVPPHLNPSSEKARFEAARRAKRRVDASQEAAPTPASETDAADPSFRRKNQTVVDDGHLTAAGQRRWDPPSSDITQVVHLAQVVHLLRPADMNVLMDPLDGQSMLGRALAAPAQDVALSSHSDVSRPFQGPSNDGAAATEPPRPSSGRRGQRGHRRGAPPAASVSADFGY